MNRFDYVRAGTVAEAVQAFGAGARFIATNPDATGPSKDGPLPATGAIAPCAPICC